MPDLSASDLRTFIPAKVVKGKNTGLAGNPISESLDTPRPDSFS